MFLCHKDDRGTIATDEVVSGIRTSVIDDDDLMNWYRLTQDTIEGLLE
jgi:hypothetical protein